jgi:hypothetical protein
VPLAILVADCVALSFFDPGKAAIGVAHAGWKGTLGGIAGATVAAMSNAFGTEPRELLVGVSPSIGSCHYEVGDDVAQSFRGVFGNTAGEFLSSDAGRFRLDLWEANRRQLIDAGVPEDRIEVAGRCTACAPDSFYSHRRDQGTTGRFAAVMMLHYTGSRSY